MGHDNHFLERLERVSLPDVELAMSLYRDPVMVETLLGEVRLPDGATRVALALRDEPDSPHIVVTREGRFVTCLAAGMTTSDLPVIPRGKLDSVASWLERLREQMALAKHSQGRNTLVGQLLDRIARGGDEISREDMHALVSWEPLLGAEYQELFLEATRIVTEYRNVVRGLRKKKLLPPDLRALREYWQATWAMGHLAIVSAIYVKRSGFFEDEESEAVANSVLHSITWPLNRLGALPMSLRASWVAAHVGKPLLAPLKRRLRNAETSTQYLDAITGLMAVGLRHAKVRAEVIKVVGSTQVGAETALGQAIRREHEGCMAALVGVLERPEEAIGIHLATGAQWIADTVPVSDNGFSEQINDPGLVPTDLAHAVLVNVQADVLNASEPRGVLFMCLPWVVRARPESLYLPKDFVAATNRPWTPEATFDFVDAIERYYGLRRPVRSAPKPGRNEPCPCGSGLKYKRCCGAKSERADV